MYLAIRIRIRIIPGILNGEEPLGRNTVLHQEHRPASTILIGEHTLRFESERFGTRKFVLSFKNYGLHIHESSFPFYYLTVVLFINVGSDQFKFLVEFLRDLQIDVLEIALLSPRPEITRISVGARFVNIGGIINLLEI